MSILKEQRVKWFTGVDAIVVASPSHNRTKVLNCSHGESLFQLLTGVVSPRDHKRSIQLTLPFDILFVDVISNSLFEKQTYRLSNSICF